jgi:OOP family OmpA-OmpF porin
MSSRYYCQLVLSTSLAFFAGAIITGGPIGCSSVNKVNYDSSTNPKDEAARLDQDIASGYQQHYDVLARSDFDNAQRELAKAKKEMGKEAKNEKVLSTLGSARAYLNRAKETSESLHDRTKGILEARAAALNAGVRNYPREAEAFAKQDELLSKETANIATGKTSVTAWSKLQEGYYDLETKSIQDSKLADARARIDDAIKHGAQKNTPNMLKQAQRDAVSAENVIAANRHDDEGIQPSVDRANQSSTLLIAVLAATKRPEGVINEDAARTIVIQGRKLSHAQEKLGDLSSETEEQSAQLTEQQKMLKHASAALNLDNALESARKEFTSDEADVYRQGDKLLIRLKSVAFPVGRADLPPASLPVLAKVKTIAEELNPVQITVEGHTDSTGKAQMNKLLSQNRAEAVATYLGDNGIDKEKISAVGKGYEKPLSSNKSKAGRAQNRRVDVIIIPAPASSNTSM